MLCRFAPCRLRGPGSQAVAVSSRTELLKIYTCCGGCAGFGLLKNARDEPLTDPVMKHQVISSTRSLKGTTAARSRAVS
jgi:hypothetical protein